jgi:hypothetical protein
LERSTEELEAQQRRREAAEGGRAREASDADERAQHARRADKAGYLRRRLAERAAAERVGDRRPPILARLRRWWRHRLRAGR